MLMEIRQKAPGNRTTATGRSEDKKIYDKYNP